LKIDGVMIGVKMRRNVSCNIHTGVLRPKLGLAHCRAPRSLDIVSTVLLFCIGVVT
jgi:hypothetical protein